MTAEIPRETDWRKVPVELGDMTVIGNAPPKLMKALAVIADMLHPAFDENPHLVKGISKRSCVLCSLTVREFLFRIGFRDAKVIPVSLIMESQRDGKTLHSLGVGVPRTGPANQSHWNGHMVVVVPSVNFLIDTTLYAVKRPAWDFLPGMIALELATSQKKIINLMSLAALSNEHGGYEFGMRWLDNPTNKGWRSGPDAIDRSRRVAVVEAMGRKFYPWMDD